MSNVKRIVNCDALDCIHSDEWGICQYSRAHELFLVSGDAPPACANYRKREKKPAKQKVGRWNVEASVRMSCPQCGVTTLQRYSFNSLKDMAELWGKCWNMCWACNYEWDNNKKD